MRRRAFVQLTGLYAASVVLPTLSGCSAPEEPRPASAAPGAANPAGDTNPTSLTAPASVTTGSGSRAVASDGSVALLLPDEHSVDVFDPTGAPVARLGGSALAGTRSVGTFNAPIAAVWDEGASRLLVLEKGNARIQAVAPSGKAIAVVAETAIAPTDLAVDPHARTLYVAVPLFHRIDVLDASGRALRSIGTFGTSGSGLNGPLGAALSPDGSLHVVDAGSGRVKVFGLDGRFIGDYGASGSDEARLVAPRAIRFDSAGRAWVADAGGSAVRVYDAQGGFVAKITPRMPDGRVATPVALSALPDGSVYASVVAASSAV
jgi:hypothetical protein